MTKTHTTIDHRTRVGSERRRKMRLRLIEAALVVFNAKGLEATLIDDVISSAGVSRGTFYNYFNTVEELLAALGEELGNDILRAIESTVASYPDPVLRLAEGMRVYLHTLSRYPDVVSFFWRAGFHAISPNNLVYDYLPPHIDDGIAAGVLQVADAATAIDIIAGVTLAAARALSTRSVPADYPEQMVGHILLALGVRTTAVRKLLASEIPRIVLPTDSLIARLAAR